MNAHDFHNILLTEKGHKLVNCDIDTYEIINHDTFSAFEDYIVPEDRDDFMRHLQENDHEWFQIGVQGPHGLTNVAVRLLPDNPAGYLNLQMVRISVVVEDSERLSNREDSFQSLISMYGDTCFIYDIGTDEVEVMNSNGTKFDSGRYAVKDFEKILSDSTGDTNGIHAFLRDVRQSNGRFTQMFNGNLVNQDEHISQTMIRGCSITHHDGTVSIVGVIHPIRQRGAGMDTGLQRDALTGLVNKADIERLAKERLANLDGRHGTLVIINIDFFKNVNDTYGHQTGDMVLKKIGNIIENEVGTKGIAGRYGGDEFMVLLYTDVESELRMILGNIKNTTRTAFPGYGPNGDLITVSIGSASYPKDASNYEDILTIADHCLYIAKRKGRNRFIMYVPAKHGTLDEIRAERSTTRTFDDERSDSPGEVIADLIYRMHHVKKPALADLLNEFSRKMDIPNIMIFDDRTKKVLCTGGTLSIDDPEVLAMMSEKMNKGVVLPGNNDFVVIDSLEMIPEKMKELVDFLTEIRVKALIAISSEDADGHPLILVFTSDVKKKWNQMHYKYYRIFSDLLKEYKISACSDQH